jgi:hypothetical protein
MVISTPRGATVAALAAPTARAAFSSASPASKARPTLTPAGISGAVSSPSRPPDSAARATGSSRSTAGSTCGSPRSRIPTSPKAGSLGPPISASRGSWPTGCFPSPTDSRSRRSSTSAATTPGRAMATSTATTSSLPGVRAGRRRPRRTPSTCTGPGVSIFPAPRKARSSTGTVTSSTLERRRKARRSGRPRSRANARCSRMPMASAGTSA